jgi:Cu/Ag efflux protein CusF
MKFMKSTIAALAFAVAFPLAGFAEEETAAVPGRLAVGSAAAIATVQDIDQESRLVTLRHPDGTMDSFIAGDEVRNLAQVKKGDVVLMEYYEGFAVALGPPSDVRAKISTMKLERAPEGEKPAAKLTETVEIVARVEEIDREKRLAALSGPKRTVVIKVADDVDLEKVKVGDEVMAVYRESFAVSVQPAPEVSGTVKIETTSVALGVGVEWGSGTLSMYDGSTHEFKISGISVVDIGVSKINLAGEVYKLKDPADFAGNYISGEAGGALGAGGSGVVMKNEKGVLMRLTSKQKGLKLTLAGKGLSVEMAQ